MGQSHPTILLVKAPILRHYEHITKATIVSGSYGEPKEAGEMLSSSVIPEASRERPRSAIMAWRAHEFGPPEVMTFERVPRPESGPGEVLVKFEAAGVGPWDGWIRAGKSALPQPLPLTLGSDLSGEFEALAQALPICAWEIRRSQPKGKIVLAATSS